MVRLVQHTEPGGSCEGERGARAGPGCGGRCAFGRPRGRRATAGANAKGGTIRSSPAGAGAADAGGAGGCTPTSPGGLGGGGSAALAARRASAIWASARARMDFWERRMDFWEGRGLRECLGFGTHSNPSRRHRLQGDPWSHFNCFPRHDTQDRRGGGLSAATAGATWPSSAPGGVPGNAPMPASAFLFLLWVRRGNSNRGGSCCCCCCCCCSGGGGGCCGCDWAFMASWRTCALPSPCAVPGSMAPGHGVCWPAARLAYTRTLGEGRCSWALCEWSGRSWMGGWDITASCQKSQRQRDDPTKRRLAAGPGGGGKPERPCRPWVGWCVGGWVWVWFV